jgi:two-component system, cell cycle response regulator
VNLSRRGRIALRLVAGIAFAGVAAYAGESLTGALDARDFFETWIYDGLILTAAGLCIARAVIVSTQRWAWAVLGLALVAWTAGDVYYSLFLFQLDKPPLPSVSDALWLSFYPACYVAVVLLVRERVPEFRTSLWLDGLVGSLAAAALAAALLFGAGRASNGETVRVDLTYELGDLLLLAFVVAVLAITGWRPGRALAMVAAGIVGSALGDGYFLYYSATGTEVTSTLAATLWPASALVIGCAAWQPPMVRQHVRLEGWRVFLVPSALAAAGLGLVVYDAVSSLNPLALGLSVATLAAVIIRMAVTYRENARLLNKSRVDALTDPLTGLGNRRKLMIDLDEAVEVATAASPCAVLLFDLNGFKAYNDRFGHPLGDALLVRLGRELQAAVEPSGNAYRLGGDEFCVIGEGNEGELETTASAAGQALLERGKGFLVSASCGIAIVPRDAPDASLAVQLADERLYAQKQGSRRTSVNYESGADLLRAFEERDPSLRDRLDRVALLARAVAERLGISGTELDDLTRAAQLHDVGKIAVPDAVLQKAGPLDAIEWEFLRQHTIVGERILNSAPSLTSVAKLVRSSHERYDGRGYPDGKSGTEIPLGSRIIAACDAFHAMTSNRPYGRSMTSDEALEELCRYANHQFDPIVVEALSGVLSWERIAQRRHLAAASTRAVTSAQTSTGG